MKKERSYQNDNDLLRWYSDNDIINIDDLISLGKEECMNKVLNQVHKYKIYQTSKGEWRTYLPDETKPEGRKAIVRKNKNDLIRLLLEFYKDAIEPDYTMQSLWSEFEAYRVVMQKANTIKEDIKAYNKFYLNDEISTRQLSSISGRKYLSTNVCLCNRQKCAQRQYHRSDHCNDVGIRNN